jgi:hypothetical protein
MWWGVGGASHAGGTRRCSTRRITIISASTPTPRATTSITARRTTAPAAAFCWRWRGRLRSRGQAAARGVLCRGHGRGAGLLGSQYLGMHPPVPAGRSALDLNYDMLLPVGIPRSVSLGGAERIDFWPDVEIGCQGLRFTLQPDPAAGPATTTAPTTSRWRGWAFRRSRSTRATLFEGHDGMGQGAG